MEPLLDIDSYLDVLRERAALAVVYSEDPAKPGAVVERTYNSRSWKSYQAVAEEIAAALSRQGFKCVETVSEGVALRQAAEQRRYQLYWLNCGGMQGRAPSAHTSSFLESLGYPYVGHTPLQAALLDDKVLLKQWLRGVGLPTATFLIRGGGSRATVSRLDPDYVRTFGARFEGPFLLKPALGRGSVDVCVVEQVDQLDGLIAELISKTNDRVLIEQFLPGQEFCVWASRGIEIRNGKAVSAAGVTAFGHAERLYSFHDRIYRKEAQDPKLVDPSRLLTEREQRLCGDLSYIARGVFGGLALYVPVRIDLRLDEGGSLSVLEVNPKPDLAPPKAEQPGLLAAALQDLNSTYDDFIVKVLADWLDFHLRYVPKSLTHLQPLFERYRQGQAIPVSPAAVPLLKRLQSGL